MGHSKFGLADYFGTMSFGFLSQKIHLRGY